MIREHLVNGLITNNGECICNPEVLLGTNYGPFSIENETAPKGMLFDLNAAWEIFLSKKDLKQLRFRRIESPQGGTYTIDGLEPIQYEADQTLWVLYNEETGEDTHAWLITDKSYGVSLNDLEFENDTLYMYYDLPRVLTSEEYDNKIPYHYLKQDGSITGNPDDPDIVKDLEGNPYILSFIGVNKNLIFDLHELHSLFPWYADPNHVIRLRLNIDDSSNTHPSLRAPAKGESFKTLGDMTITPESEVFVAELPFTEAQGNNLISLQSIYEWLQSTIGVVFLKQEIPGLKDEGGWYEEHNTEGKSNHFRVNGTNISLNLNFYDLTNVTNIVEALNYLNDSLNGKAWNAILKLLELINGKPIITNSFTLYQLPNTYNPDEDVCVDEHDIDIITGIKNYTGDIDISPTESIFVENAEVVLENGKYYAKVYDEPTPENVNWNLTRINDKLKSMSNCISGKDSYLDVVDILNYLQEQIDKLFNDLDTLGDDIRKKIGWNTSTNTWMLLNTNYFSASNLNIIPALNELGEKVKDLEDDTTLACQVGNALNIAEAVCDLANRVSTIESHLLINNWNNLETENKLDFVSIINELYDIIQNNKNEFDLCCETVKNKIGWDNSKNPENWKDLNDHFATTQPEKTNMPIIDALNQLGNEIDELGSESPFEYVDSLNKNATGVRLKNRENTASDGSFVVGTNNKSNNNLTGNQNRGQNNLIFGSNNEANTANKSIILGSNNQVSGETIGTIGDSNNITGENINVLGNNNTARNSSNSVILGNNITSQTGQNIILNVDGNLELPNNVNDIISLGKLSKYYGNSTHIAKDIYFLTKNGNVEDKLQDLIFVDLGNWAINYSSNNLINTTTPIFNGITNITDCIKKYILSNDGLAGNNRRYCLKFKYLYNSYNYDGIALVENNSVRLVLHNTTYFTNNININQPLWHRREGVKLCIAYNGNNAYLAFSDLNSILNPEYNTSLNDSNTNIANINLQDAFGAIPISEIRDLLDIPDKSKIVYKENWTDNSGITYQGGKIQLKAINYTTVDTNECNPLTVNESVKNITYNKSGNYWLIDLAPYMKKLQATADKGVPGGYVPLGCNGLIETQYLPGLTDEVIDCWAVYSLSDPSDEQSDPINISLYVLTEVNASNVTQSQITLDGVVYDYTYNGNQAAIKEGNKYYIKGDEITETGQNPSSEDDPTKAKNSAIYIEANKDTNPIHQFRWTGTKWVPIKGKYLIIGHETGTALDGKEGWDHITDMNNPHETDLKNLLSETFDDANYSSIGNPLERVSWLTDNNNGTTTGTPFKHVLEIYDRLNRAEDFLDTLNNEIDALPEHGPIIKEHITYSVNTFFNLYE